MATKGAGITALVWECKEDLAMLFLRSVLPIHSCLYVVAQQATAIAIAIAIVIAIAIGIAIVT